MPLSSGSSLSTRPLIVCQAAPHFPEQHYPRVGPGIPIGRRFFENPFEQRKPASLKIVTLLDKPERRISPVHVSYIGFQIPDEFVVGYGLDYAERYRNLPYVGVLRLASEAKKAKVEE